MSRNNNFQIFLLFATEMAVWNLMKKFKKDLGTLDVKIRIKSLNDNITFYYLDITQIKQCQSIISYEFLL